MGEPKMTDKLATSTDIAELLRHYENASDAVVKAVKARFPRGSVIHWMARDYRQTGEIVEVLGFAAHHLQLRVLNRGTGRIVDLFLYRIEEIR